MLEAVGPTMLRLGTVHVFVDDWYIPPERWRVVRPKPDRTITIRVAPQGGGDDKNPLRTILTIAVIAAAVVAPELLLAEGATLFGSSALATAAVSAAVATAGMMLVNAIAPPGRPRLPELSGTAGAESPTLSIVGARNALRPFGRIPRLYGRHKTVPPLGASTFTELVGDDQYVRQIFCFGYGPLKLEEEKIGETALSAFSDVEEEFRRGFQPDQLTDRGGWDASAGTFPAGPSFGDWYTVTVAGTVGGVAFAVGDTIVYQGLGASDQDAASWDKNGNAPLTLYPDSVDEQALSIELTQAGSWQTRTSAADADELSVEVSFPEGLVAIDDTGAKLTAVCDLEIEYAPAGSGAWVSLGTDRVSGRRSSAVRHGNRWPVARGQYDVRVRRLTADTDETPGGAYPFGGQGTVRIFNDSFWTALRSFTDEDPIAKDGMCVKVLRIRATGQLNGAIDEYSAVATSMLPDWDSTAQAWIVKPTANPASCYRDALQGAANARALADARIDLAGLEAWHEENAAAGRTFNHVYDYAASVQQCLADVAAAGRAAPFRPDGKWGVAVDKAGLVPVQHFTPRNSWGYSGRIVYPEIPHAFRVRFINEDQSFRADERVVYDDGFTAANATRFAGLELPGKTDSGEVWADARYHIADLRLRREHHSWFADVEHMVCTRGDKVLLTHDVVEIGIAAGRIKAVIADGGGNVTGLTVDEALTMELGKSYGISIRTLDDVALTRQVTTDPGAQTTIQLAASIPPAEAPAPGDLFGFGELGQETLALIVKSIEPGQDLSARITAVDAAEAVHEAGALPRDFAPGDVDAIADTITHAGHGFFDGDDIRFSSTGTLPGGLSPAITYSVVNRSEDAFQVSQSAGGAAVDLLDGGSGTHTAARQIPAFTSTLTVAPGAASPAIVNIRSDGSVRHPARDGTFSSLILVSILPPAQDGIGGVEAAYRVEGSAGAWLQTPVQPADGGQVQILPVEDGVTYELMLRWVLRGGQRGAWGSVQSHTVVGKIGPPANVDSFTVTRMADGTRRFAWEQAVVPPDVRSGGGWVIRYAAGTGHAWEELSPLHDGLLKASPFETNELAAGTYTFGIKAQDASGNQSETAAVIEATLGDPRLREVLLARDARALGWPGTLGDFYRETDGTLEAVGAQTWADLPATWAELADSWRDIVPAASPASYTTPVLDLGTETSFTPRVSVDGEGAFTLEMRTGSAADGAPTGLFVPLAPVSGVRYIELRATVTDTTPILSALVVLLDGATQIEGYEDVDTSAGSAGPFERIATGHFKLATRGNTAAITTAAVLAFQNAGAGWTWELIGKATTITGGSDPAAEFKIYQNGVLADAVIDAEIKGPRI